MTKIIEIEDCSSCPYNTWYVKGDLHVCSILNKPIPDEILWTSILEDCPLDDNPNDY